MRAKNVRVIFEVDGKIIFDEKFNDCDVSYSADYDVKTVHTDTGQAAVIEYTGKRNIALAVKMFDPDAHRCKHTRVENIPGAIYDSQDGEPYKCLDCGAVVR